MLPHEFMTNRKGIKRYKNNSRVVYHPVSEGEKELSLQDESVIKLLCHHV